MDRDEPSATDAQCSQIWFLCHLFSSGNRNWQFIRIAAWSCTVNTEDRSTRAAVTFTNIHKTSSLVLLEKQHLLLWESSLSKPWTQLHCQLRGCCIMLVWLMPMQTSVSWRLQGVSARIHNQWLSLPACNCSRFNRCASTVSLVILIFNWGVSCQVCNYFLANFHL